MSEQRYYLHGQAPQPVFVQEQKNHWPIIMLVVGVFLAIQFNNKQWPFKPVLPPNPAPAPVIIDDRDNTQPTPQPDVVPKTKASWVLLIDETENRPADRQFVFNDYGFWFEELPQAGIRHRFFDVEDAEAETFIMRAAAENVEPPFVMSLSENGDMVGLIPFPTTKNVDPIRKMLK